MNAALKLGGIAIGAVALSLAVADWRGARQARGELRICAAAAGDVSKPVDGCTGKIAAAIVAKRQGAACEGALAKDDLWMISTACGPQVRERVARQRTAEANLADANRQLALAEQRALAAISRAEGRAIQTAERKARAEAVIDRAPRDAAGLIVCNAGCLRDLASAATAAQH